MRRVLIGKSATAIIGITEVAGGVLLFTYLVRSITRGGVPLSAQLSLGLFFTLLSILAGILLLKHTFVGNLLSRFVQAIQVVSIALPKLGFVVVLGPQLRISLSGDPMVNLNAGFFAFYALFVGNKGGLPWGVNVVPAVCFLLLMGRTRSATKAATDHALIAS